MTTEAPPTPPTPQGQETTEEENQKKGAGSGLTLFLRDFLPPFQPTDGARNAYSTSLSEVPPATQAFVRHSEHNRGVYSNDDDQLTYREWRDEQKQILMDYLARRLTEENLDDDNDTDDPSDDGRGDGGNDESFDLGGGHASLFETQPESQAMFETQPDTQPMFEETEESSMKRPMKRQKRREIVPHINDAVHEVSKLDYLDLYTQSLRLPLCRVVKVWKKRDTRRGGTGPLKDVAKQCPRFQHHYRTVPRIPFGDMEEDGPVASTYRTVLNMEVEQLRFDEGSDTVAPIRTSDTPLRIKLFFYNAYAERMGEWMDQQWRKKNDNFVLSLSLVPAHCIFPRAKDPYNWMEQHSMVEYCVCIGDTSSAKTTTDGASIRFDDNLVQVNVASRSILKDESETEESSILAEELVLSQRICDERQFLSSSSESESVTFRVQEPISIQNIWSLFIRREEAEKLVENHGTRSQEGEISIGQGSSEASNVLGVASQRTESEVGTSYQIAPMTFNGSAKRTQKDSPLEYVKLSQLRNVIDRAKEDGVKPPFVNIYGLVMGFTSPNQTRRGDWMTSAMLVDESCTTPVTILMFCNVPQLLPNLLWMGDVLRVHRVELQEWGSGVQLLAPKYKSSFVVIRNSPGEGWHGLPTASNSFSFRQSDERRSQELWEWGQKFVSDSPTINKEHCFTLAEMVAMNNEEEDKLKDGDITVMVAGVYPYPQQPSGVTPWGMMRIWDGTGIAPSDPFPVKTIFSQQAESNGDPPPEALQNVVKIVEKMRESSPDIVTPLSFCGRVANVLIWEEVHWALLKEKVQPGTFIRLRNVDIRRWQYNPFRSLMVHSKTWLTPVPNQNHEVRSLLEAHNHRVLRGDYNTTAGILRGSSQGRNSQQSSTTLHTDNEVETACLKKFVDRENVGKFSGTVSVKLVTESPSRAALMATLEQNHGLRNPIVFTIKDKSVSVMALASEKTRQKLHQILSHPENGENVWNDISRSDPKYSTTIRSVDWNHHRYFVLTDMIPLEAEE